MTVTVAELRNELVDKHGWDRADADALKGKANLIAALEKSQQENPVDFDDLDVTVMHDENTDVSSDDAGSAPSIFSPEWTDYVLGLLTRKELTEGNPKTDGLYRVAQLIFGRASVHSDPIHVCMGQAVVKVSITFPDGETYEDVAEVYIDDQYKNTDPPYSKYPAATAHTRALGRALRRALNIQVVTAEELSDSARLETIVPHDEKRTEGAITDTQVKFIDMMCSPAKLDLNVQNVVNNLFPNTNNINELSHESALHINEVLSQWQQNRDSIPQGIGPYNPDWRSSF